MRDRSEQIQPPKNDGPMVKITVPENGGRVDEEISRWLRSLLDKPVTPDEGR